jgi:hypothetical protein
MRKYRQQPVGRQELRSLVQLSKSEESAFFTRNPHLVKPYRRRLLAVALCQGAALQYLGVGYGVKDFDVHFFYDQNPAKPRLSRRVRRVCADVGRFEDVPVDFIRTVVPPAQGMRGASATERLRAFLTARPTANAKHLSRKAVVMLLPSGQFAKAVWVSGPSAHHQRAAKGSGLSRR